MKQIILINQSTDPQITNGVLLQLAAALSIQNQRDFVPVYDGVKGPDGVAIDAQATFSVAEADAGLPVGAIPLFIQDAIDGGPGILGFHDVEDGSVPVIRIGWTAIKENGGSLFTGSNSLSVTCSHEVCECLADITAGCWVTKADGVTKEAFEVCDGCEGNSYPVPAPEVGAQPAQSYAMSNFLYPAWFVLGSTGKMDFLGLVPAPQTKDAGGYEIDESPNGTISNNFAKTVEEGGMPQWRRDQIALKAATPGTRHHHRRNKNKKPVETAKLVPGETTFSNEHGSVTCKADGSIVIRTKGTAEIHVTSAATSTSPKESP